MISWVLFLIFYPKFIHLFPDNRMDAATKSRTSEDILRSSRLSTYSPEPYSQSECDYYPYASSPKGTNLHLTFLSLAAIAGCFSFCCKPNSQVQLLFNFLLSYLFTRPLCTVKQFIFIQGNLFYSAVFPLSLSDAKKTLLNRRRWRKLESQSSKGKGFIIFLLSSTSGLKKILLQT